MDISKFTVEDFVNDPGFIEWVRKTGSERAGYWDLLIHRHPEKEDEIKQAVELVLALKFKTRKMSGSDFGEVRARALSSIQSDARPVNKIRELSPARFIVAGWEKAAAAVSVLAIAGWALYFFLAPGNMVTEATAYGEKKELTLPDGSVVTLNANSEISYSSEWETAEERKVRLHGEGYFIVQEKRHNNEKIKFLVNAGDITVEVVGTSFNVKQREEKVEVVLEEGKVNIQDLKEQYRLELTPGELAKYSEENFEKQKINTSIYTAWRDNKMVFESTPVEDILEDIRYLFGVEVRILDQRLASKEFTGIFPADNLDVLVTSLCKAFNLEPEQPESDEDIIFLKAK